MGAKYYLGVDGGNTKTHIALYCPETDLLDLYRGGGSNYEVMAGGYAELSQVLKGMFEDFLSRHRLSLKDIHRAGLGMAGVDTKTQHDEISKVLSSLGLGNFDLGNDCVLGIKAAAESGYGISCVSGTGFSVVGLDENDVILQVGGMGYVTGDKGGGGYVTTEGISYVYGELFKRYAPSMLTDMLMKYLNITDKNDFMEAIHIKYYNEDIKGFTLAMSKMVFEAAEKGDKAATGILTGSAHAYGESVLGIFDNLSFNAGVPEIVLTGSLFQKNPESVLTEALTTYITTHYKKPFSVKVLDAPSVLGGLAWAFKNDGGLPKRDDVGKRLNIMAAKTAQ